MFLLKYYPAPYKHSFDIDVCLQYHAINIQVPHTTNKVVLQDIKLQKFMVIRSYNCTSRSDICMYQRSDIATFGEKVIYNRNRNDRAKTYQGSYK